MASLLSTGGRRCLFKAAPRTSARYTAALSTAAEPTSTLFEAANPPPTISTNPTSPSEPSTSTAPSPRPKAPSTPELQPVTRTIPLSTPAPRSKPLLPSGIPNRERYNVLRTPSKNLAIYETAKRGGNLHLTTVRKISGDTEALRAQIEEVITPRAEYVRVNPTTGHVVLKGWYKKQIETFLTAKGF